MKNIDNVLKRLTSEKNNKITKNMIQSINGQIKIENMMLVFFFLILFIIFYQNV